MTRHAQFWQLEHLSDRQLLDGLGTAANQQRRALAELVAHLGEVEERRLHLAAAHGSMFEYCVAGLGMSEDEACRRLELARLARKFPALFPLLATGEVSLSVALILKPILTFENHGQVLSAARNRSMREARELVATFAPRPDVASSIRKLPGPRVEMQRAAHPNKAPALVVHEAPPDSLFQAAPAKTIPAAPFPLPPARPTIQSTTPVVDSLPARARATSRIEPLSAERYKIQLTADAALKAKLEQARDLLRHAHPNGDFAPILDRALDLLIADLLKRRFGAGARPKPRRTRKPQSAAAVAATPRAECRPTPPGVATVPLQPARAETPPTAPDSAPLVPCESASTATRHPVPAHIRRAARREVLERDGLGCTWVGANGRRCGSRAWIELDHRRPKGKGGGSEADNLRVLCRAHNRLAAEREYGRLHMAQAIAARVEGSKFPRPSGSR